MCRHASDAHMVRGTRYNARRQKQSGKTMFAHVRTEAAEDEHRVGAQHDGDVAGARPRVRAAAPLPRPVPVAQRQHPHVRIPLRGGGATAATEHDEPVSAVPHGAVTGPPGWWQLRRCDVRSTLLLH